MDPNQPNNPTAIPPQPPVTPIQPVAVPPQPIQAPPQPAPIQNQPPLAPLQPPVTPIPTPNIQQPPVASPQMPTGMPMQIPEKVAPKITTTAITAIVLGGFMIALGGFLAITMSMSYILSAVFGVVYLVFGIILLSQTKDLANILLSIRVLYGLVLINMVISLLSGNGAGLLPLLLLVFSNMSISQLYEAGLVTTKSIVNTKPKF